MNLLHLEAFKAVMTTGTFSSAGKIVGRSQPSVSRIVDALENELDVVLFERRRGKAVPTDAAHELLDELERILVSMKKIKDFASQTRSAGNDAIGIGVMPALATSFLPRVIARFARQFPDTRVAMNVRFTPTVEEGAATQLFDIGLAEEPFHRTGFETKAFIRAPCTIAVPLGHPLAEARVITPPDLRGVTLISGTPFTAARHLSDAIFRAAGVTVRPRFETTLALGGLALVQNGMGLGLVDPVTAAEHAGAGVRLVPFRPEIPFNVGMLLPDRRRKGAALDALVAVLLSERDDLLQKLPVP